ncbi:hypothetical protein NC653_039403 [Populus alba x Populus x berolinensis]|uniref:MTD1 n=1 Tax=Populus alba x Populus x berolinensis TaxID=444605 RepID=A0AAD6LB65_9ROSI|nr:hypothetical protein NC653_039403 [Populus alba x Populus x berolinensis]
MSIAVDSTCNIDMDSTGFPRGRLGCVVTSSVFESPVGRREEMAEECSPSSLTTSSKSSIGKDSDLSGGGEDGLDENEVQSAYKGALDSMEGLEEVLPIRRGISKFYDGKSKSFTILSDASSSPSIKDIAKPENAFTRKRRNLLAFNHFWEKNRGFPHRNGISKRPISSSKSTLALAVAMSSSESISSASEDSNSTSASKSPPHLPPLHPRSRASHNNLASLPSPRQSFSPWRSFSLADLQQCGTLLQSYDDSLNPCAHLASH